MKRELFQPRRAASQILTVLSLLHVASRRPFAAARPQCSPSRYVCCRATELATGQGLPDCAVLSALPEARRDPSGLQATACTGLEWPRMVKSSLPFARSQTLIRLSCPPEANRLPSGLHVTELAPDGMTAQDQTGSCIAARSQILIKLSRPHEAIRVPSGLHATD